MESTHDCPLCADTYGRETDLRVHLEVEHRKSELAERLVAVHRTADPVVTEDPGRSGSDQPTPRL